MNLSILCGCIERVARKMRRKWILLPLSRLKGPQKIHHCIWQVKSVNIEEVRKTRLRRWIANTVQKISNMNRCIQREIAHHCYNTVIKKRKFAKFLFNFHQLVRVEKGLLQIRRKKCMVGVCSYVQVYGYNETINIVRCWTKLIKCQKQYKFGIRLLLLIMLLLVYMNLKN